MEVLAFIGRLDRTKKLLSCKSASVLKLYQNKIHGFLGKSGDGKITQKPFKHQSLHKS
jgi:hypothetical protein